MMTGSSQHEKKLHQLIIMMPSTVTPWCTDWSQPRLDTVALVTVAADCRDTAAPAALAVQGYVFCLPWWKVLPAAVKCIARLVVLTVVKNRSYENGQPRCLMSGRALHADRSLGLGNPTLETLVMIAFQFIGRSCK